MTPRVRWILGLIPDSMAESLGVDTANPMTPDEKFRILKDTEKQRDRYKTAVWSLSLVERDGVEEQIRQLSIRIGGYYEQQVKAFKENSRFDPAPPWFVPAIEELESLMKVVGDPNLRS